MKCFDVTFIAPWNGREMRSMEVSANRIYQHDSGEMVYRYNDRYNACEVVTACEVPQPRIDAQAAYFNKYGRACE